MGWFETHVYIIEWLGGIAAIVALFMSFLPKREIVLKGAREGNKNSPSPWITKRGAQLTALFLGFLLEAGLTSLRTASLWVRVFGGIMAVILFLVFLVT
jgi:hypothetical protein